jgi:hypothetical protein
VTNSIVYDGLNGEAYRFLAIDMSDQRALPVRGGVIVVAKDKQTPVYIGYASSIQTHVTRANLWNTARHAHGATHVYVLPSGNASWCQSAVDNLTARYKPVMNG